MKHKIAFVLLFAVVTLSVVGGLSRKSLSNESGAVSHSTELSRGVYVIAEENGKGGDTWRGAFLFT